VKTMTNADPRMKGNMVSHIDNVWSASDGDLFVYYCSTGNEYAWPFTNDLYNLNTPKLQAIDQLNTVNKVAPTICSVPPCILNGTDFEYNWAIGSYPYSSGTVYHIKQNAYLIYMFRVVTPGTYNVSASLNANTGPLSIVVDGVLLGTESVKGTLPSYTMANMQPGLHTVMFKTSTGETEFVTVTINTGAGQKGIITAIDNPQIDKSLSVYPNPANNLLNVNYISDRNAEIKVNILDLSGVMMMNETRTVLTGSNSIQFNTDYLKSGVYILRIQNENTIYNQKVIIKK